jgi:hypothetical protein
MSDIEKGENDLLDLRQGRVHVRDFLRDIKEVSINGNFQEAYDRILPLSQLMANQIENTIAEKDQRGSFSLGLQVENYQKYVPHDDVVEQGLNDVQPREDFSELAQQIAKYHIAKMYEGKFQNVVSEFENVLEQAERETKK